MKASPWERGLRGPRMKSFGSMQVFIKNHFTASVLRPRVRPRRFFTSSCERKAKNVLLACSPLSAKMDEKVNIDVEGLEPNQKLSLQAKVVGDSNDRYHSLAHYIADQQGRVCLNSQPSVGGSYVGVEPMGFMWSLQPEPNQKPGRRLLKRDVTKPYLVNLALLDGHVDILKTENCHPLSSLTIERHYMSAGVRRIDVHEGRIRGTLFLPPGNGPFQGVIELRGNTGGLFEYKAALLASNGFAALSLAYVYHDDLPTRMSLVELEYFIEAISWLKNHPAIIPGGIGLVGISRGAEVSLYIASYSKDVSAVVAINGSPGLSIATMHYEGKPLPFVKADRSKIAVLDGYIHQWKDMCIDDWSGSIQENPKVAPVENSNASFLLVYGSHDLLLDGQSGASRIYERLKAFGKEAQCTRLGFHGAGHLIEPPYSPVSFMSYVEVIDICLAWGGQQKEHAVAQEHAWSRILRFFYEHLPRCNY